MIYFTFLHVDHNITAQRTGKTFHCSRFLLHKRTQKANYTGALKSASSSSNDWRQTCEWRGRQQLRDKLSRAIKGEVLHSQWSILLFPFAGSRPFIHWNVCTPYRLQQDISSFKITTTAWGKQMKEQKLEKGKKKSINSHACAPRMCIIYSHDITGEFCCFSFTEGFWNYFCSFPLKESLTWKKKSLKTEQNCYLVPHIRVWWIRGLPSSSGQHP